MIDLKVGEPINHEAWHWFNEVVGQKRCKIADTWWQTETGAHAMTPLPCGRNDPIKPGMAMRPFLGMKAVLLDDKGRHTQTKDASGILCLQEPWPSMARTIYGDHRRYLETYLKPFPGYYFTGDGALVDHEGYFQITGRVDDVINVSGHRIGTAEIEDVIDEHAAVAESAVVGFQHDVLGEGIFAYISLKETVAENTDMIIKEIKAAVKEKIAGYAVPHKILVTSWLFIFHL